MFAQLRRRDLQETGAMLAMTMMVIAVTMCSVYDVNVFVNERPERTKRPRRSERKPKGPQGMKQRRLKPLK
jgi:hypothetical protein